MDEQIKDEIYIAIDKAVKQLIGHFRPIIVKQDKKIDGLKTEIFNTDKKLEGMKYKVIYKTKDGFICPVCGKDMEDEIIEEALQEKDVTVKKIKAVKKLIEKK